MAIPKLIPDPKLTREDKKRLIDRRFPTGLREPLDHHELKGKKHGKCNVEACQCDLGEQGGYENKMMSYGGKKYYCLHCITDIVKANLRYGTKPEEFMNEEDLKDPIVQRLINW